MKYSVLFSLLLLTCIAHGQAKKSTSKSTDDCSKNILKVYDKISGNTFISNPSNFIVANDKHNTLPGVNIDLVLIPKDSIYVSIACRFFPIGFQTIFVKKEEEIDILFTDGTRHTYKNTTGENHKGHYGFYLVITNNNESAATFASKKIDAIRLHAPGAFLDYQLSPKDASTLAQQFTCLLPYLGQTQQ